MINAANIVATHENVWFRGRNPTELPPWKHLHEAVTTEARLPWVSMTPLLLPVVPEVKTIVARSSGGTSISLYSV